MVTGLQLCVYPRDLAALAQTVTRVLDMPVTELNAQGDKQRVCVEIEFYMAADAQKFNNLYQELLQQNS